MLSTASVQAIHAAATFLSTLEGAEPKRHAAALQALITKELSHRAAVAEGRKASGSGRPPNFYVVEADPWWRVVVKGAEAARDQVAEALREAGSKRTLPAPRSWAAMVSGNRKWTALVETDRGMLTILVRKATEKETAELLANEESGTEDAS